MRLMAAAGAAGVLAVAGVTSALAASDAHQGAHARPQVHAKQHVHATNHDGAKSSGSTGFVPSGPPNPNFKAPADSLRALAAKVGLRFGSALTPFDLVTPAESTIAQDQFSVVTPENEMKWQVVEPQRGVFDWTGADNLVNYAEQHGELVRGHTLLWHNQLPDWLTTGVGEQDASGNCPPGSPSTCISNAELKTLLHQHITTEVSRYRGRIWQWDVANEFLTDTSPSMVDPTNFWIQHEGEGIIADAFRWAHQADPKALLFYNDYNIAGEDGTNAKHDAAVALIKQLQAEHVPIDGVGDQGHLDLQFGFDPNLMAQDLQQFANMGLKVAITEADVRTFVDNATAQNPIVGPVTLPDGSTANDTNPDHTAETAEASWYDGMLSACLQVKNCISFTVWGFDDNESWVPGTFAGEGNADLYDVNLKPKPAFGALQQTLRLAANGGAPKRPNTGTPGL